MEIRFSKRALKYIRKHGAQDVFVSLEEVDVADTIGMAKDISVGFKAPDEEKQFDVHRAEGIDVHIDRALKVTGPVAIRLQGLWKISSLYANGLQVPI